MPPAQRDEAAWRYWRARAQTGARRARIDAKRAFETLAKEFHFYGLLAAEALGTSMDPASQPVTPSPEVFAAFGARADVRRAVKLAELGMRMESIREWAPIVRDSTTKRC